MIIIIYNRYPDYKIKVEKQDITGNDNGNNDKIQRDGARPGRPKQWHSVSLPGQKAVTGP